jgi:hypothetical protein
VRQGSRISRRPGPDFNTIFNPLLDRWQSSAVIVCPTLCIGCNRDSGSTGYGYNNRPSSNFRFAGWPQEPPMVNYSDYENLAALVSIF